MHEVASSLEHLLTPVEELTTHEANPRRGDIDAIAESLTSNGQYRPIVARSSGEVLAGNHTLLAARSLGWTHIAAVRLEVDDDRARRILLADNRTAELGSYDDELLAELLGELATTELGLTGSGFTTEDLDLIAALEEEAAPGGDLEDATPGKGELLELADVAWGEPTHQVHHGEVWRLGRHLLVVARLHDEHAAWSAWLEPEHVFAPYPEPYLTTSTLAAARPLLLVQPNRFLAGHLLDKHAACFPDEELARLERHEPHGAVA